MCVFFDNILLYSRSIAEQEHLGQVLKILVQLKLYANKKKCIQQG